MFVEFTTGSQSVCVLLLIRGFVLSTATSCFLSFLYSHFIIHQFQTMCSGGCG